MMSLNDTRCKARGCFQTALPLAGGKVLRQMHKRDYRCERGFFYPGYTHGCSQGILNFQACWGKQTL